MKENQNLKGYKIVKDDENYLWEEFTYDDNSVEYSLYVGGYNANTEFPHVPTSTILNLKP